MNIYDVFRQNFGRQNITRKQLRSIADKHCPNIPINLLEMHRKIYHLQLQLSYWRPINSHAEASDIGGYIDARGEIRDTCVRSRDRWDTNFPFKLRGEKAISSKQRRYNTDEYYKHILDILNDARINIVFINETAIPKWDPRSLTLCLDPISEVSRRAESLLGWKCLVLRCLPLGSDQYELWTLTKKSKKLECRIATIVGNTIGLGKTKGTSARSNLYHTAKKITQRLEL